MDEIRFVAGPIVARYLDKLEEERQAKIKVEEEKAAKIKAEADAKKKAEEEAKKAAEPSKKEENSPPTTNGANDDTEMTDAEKGPEVEDPA
jgi:heat shock protein 4